MPAHPFVSDCHRLPASFRSHRLLLALLLSTLAVVEGCVCDDNFNFSFVVRYSIPPLYWEQLHEETCNIVGDSFYARCPTCVLLPLENGSFGWGEGEGRPFWQGDKAPIVEGTTEDVTPCHSDRMLRFEATFPEDPRDEDDVSTVYQVIDVRAFNALPDPLGGVARTLVNRRRVNNQTDRAFRLTVATYTGDPATFLPGSPAHVLLASHTEPLLSDADTATWEALFNEFSLSTPGAHPDFLIVAVEAVEDVIDERGGSPAALELDAHFSDYVRIGLRPVMHDLRLAYRAIPGQGGVRIVFAMTLTNDAPSTLAATNISVVNEFQRGLFSRLDEIGITSVSLHYVAHSGDGFYDVSQGLWTVDRLEGGASASLYVAMQLTGASPGSRYQTTAAIHAGSEDQNPGNNRSTASFSPCILCSGGGFPALLDTTVAVGDTLSITYTVTSAPPPSAASAFSSKPALAAISAGPVTVNLLTSSIPIIIVGRSVGTVTGVLTVEAGLYNYADIFEVTVVAGNTPPVATDDQATTTADTPLDIDVLANDADPDGMLDPATVTVTGNPGNGTATVNLDGTITYKPNPGFTGNDTFTYTVTDDNGLTSNEATVQVTVEAMPTGYDLSLVKTVNLPMVPPSGQATFTVRVTNSGPATAAGVEVTDPLPGFGFTLQNTQTSQGTFNTGTGRWTVGDLASGQSATLTITGLIHTDQTNTATITAGLDEDTNPNNNTASATVTVSG